MTAQTIDLAVATGQMADRRSPSVPPIATALLCDNAVVRAGLEHLLAGSPFAVTRPISTSSLGLVGSEATLPALIIVAATPSSSRMAAMVRQVKEEFPQARLVVLADHFEPGCVWQAHEAGADGFCLTTTGRDALITSLELVIHGEGVLPGNLLRAMLKERSVNPPPEPQPLRIAHPLPSGARAGKLSTREAEILRCLMAGEPNKVIARKLDVTEATVKVHVKAILRKVGATNRTQAAIWATAHLPGDCSI